MMKTLFAVVASCSFIGLAGMNPAQATVVGSSADASVYISDGYANTYNNGGYAGSYSDGETARDYLKFGFPVVSGTYVASATLQLSYQGSAGNAQAPLSIYATTSSWTSSNLTWGSQPGEGALLATFNPQVSGTISIDLTAYLDAQYLSGGTASLIIGATNEHLSSGDDSWRYFRAGNETLTYTLANTNVPEPASLVLLGTGLAGAGMLRRRRAD